MNRFPGGIVPEEFQWISLSESVGNWSVSPWEWDEVGYVWVTYVRIWQDAQPRAKKLYQQMWG